MVGQASVNDYISRTHFRYTKRASESTRDGDGSTYEHNQKMPSHWQGRPPSHFFFRLRQSSQLLRMPYVVGFELPRLRGSSP